MFRFGSAISPRTHHFNKPHRSHSHFEQQSNNKKRAILHSPNNKLPPKNVKLIVPRAKSSELEADAPANNTMASNFKKWTSQKKIEFLQKAKSQPEDRGYQRYQYQTNMHSNYYQHGTINNYIDHRPRQNTISNQHTRDRSQQSMASLTMSESANTQLSNNNISSSSEDFIKENMKQSQFYTDYTSPSPTQQMTKMWQLHNNESNSTVHSVTPSIHRHNSIQGVFFEISKHLDQCTQYISEQVPREYLQVMNDAMVKVTLEFCGFDIENAKKFNALYTSLEQHLKIQNVDRDTAYVHICDIAIVCIKTLFF